MRLLTSSVLVLQAIVIGLAIPVALVVEGGSAATAWLLGALALACLLLPALGDRPGFVAAGWVLQALMIACGLLVPMMTGLGAVFAALWWTAVRLGRVSEQGGEARAG